MARPPRLVVPGQPLHLIQRGNNRSPTFFGDEDYTLFRETLLQASRRFGCHIHAYVLMTNHVHVLITPETEAGPACMMQALGRRYVRYINERYRRTGTLWEGRYKSSLVDSEHYLLVCSRYIELNPVRAGMVEDPQQYRWSSYRCNALGEVDALVTPHALYLALGSGPGEQQAAYRALFEAHLESKTLDAIRDAANKGTVLGNDRFREEIETMIHRQLLRRPHGGDRRSEAFRARREP